MIANSDNDLVLLNSDVNIEPLMCRWHAWPHLITPVQLALHITYRLLPSLESFVASPSTHIAASQDPEMYGGAFMELQLEDVAMAQKLMDDTRKNCAKLIQFAEDLRAMDLLLQEKAAGFSLDEYYALLPESLRGLVELVYDLNHHPSIKVFEDFLYDEDLTSAIQEIWLHAGPQTERPFFMSTPRLASHPGISLPISFADKRLDALASMRTKPASFQAVAELLGIGSEDMPQFRSFFSPATAPARPAGLVKPVGDEVSMRYFGHACLLFQTADVTILFDPFVSMTAADDGRLSVDDLPDYIDYVVLTHSHQDHFCMEMLIQLRHRIGQVIVPDNNSGNIADPSMKLALRELGYDRVCSLKYFEHVEVAGGKILSLPFTGEHADLNIQSKHAISLELNKKKFLFLVDSDARDIVLYKRMLAKIGQVDVLFIGMECHGAPLNWLYEPLLGKATNRRNNESRRLSGADCERAWNTVSAISPPRVFVYAMGQEPWMKFIMGLQYQDDSIQLTESNQFIERCQQAGIEAERLFMKKDIVFE